jgi:hypothetical protein
LSGSIHKNPVESDDRPSNQAGQQHVSLGQATSGHGPDRGGLNGTSQEADAWTVVPRAEYGNSEYQSSRGQG